MKVTQRFSAWARDRVAAAEPRIGVLGPVAWIFALALVAAAVHGMVNVGDSAFFVAATIAAAGLVGLATAPFWMVRVAILGHRRRHRGLREEATALRAHLEEAYVERRLDKDGLDRLADRLTLHRTGRAPGAVALTAAAYLRGVAWSLLGAGAVVALGGLLLAADMETWHAEAQHEADREFAQDWQDIGLTTATIAGISGLGTAVVLSAGAVAERRQGQRLLEQDAAELDTIRQDLLAARRS